MALIEINLNPSKRDLKWFGALALVFFSVIGSLIYWYTSAAGVAIFLWATGLLFCIVYYALPPTQRVLYIGWMRLFQPLGWIIAHVLFGIVYFAAITPIGLCLRIFKHDPMIRSRSQAKTYWVNHKAATSSSRYFRQF